MQLNHALLWNINSLLMIKQAKHTYLSKYVKPYLQINLIIKLQLLLNLNKAKTGLSSSVAKIEHIDSVFLMIN